VQTFLFCTDYQNLIFSFCRKLHKLQMTKSEQAESTLLVQNPGIGGQGYLPHKMLRKCCAISFLNFHSRMHLPRSHFLSWCRRASSAAAAKHARAESIADGANLQLQGLQETLAKVVAALQGIGEYIPNEGVNGNNALLVPNSQRPEQWLNLCIMTFRCFSGFKACTVSQI